MAVDYGAQQTDLLIAKMEKRMNTAYATAEKEMNKKLKVFLKDYNEKNKQKQKDLKSGKITQEDYNTWLKSQAFQKKQITELINTLAEDHVTTDVKAMSVVRGFMPEAYAINRNFAAFQVEKDSLVDTSYTLYDAHTVEVLIRDRPNLLPQPSPDIPKEMRWHKQKITNAITQGILQGESIPDIATRLQEVTDMDRRAAVRNARTATTAAQNKGRVDSYKDAEKLGIDLMQEWLATLDGRTRHSHRLIDGERVKVGDTFSNGCRYPGDPAGSAAETYNCRCTLVATIAGITDDLPINQKFAGMSYDEWKYEKSRPASVSSEEIESTKFVIVEGKDISDTWQRRTDKFDFEIEDVINAQGFDGLPRVVSAEEFDEAVKAANGGNGFIAQRTYSAPDQETLDAYRDQLYNGKWYVDCSTGGAQYGQGMYCAADYSGQLTDGIKSEMKHYVDLGESRMSLIDYRQEVADKRADDAQKAFDNIIKNAGLTQEEDLIFRANKIYTANSKELDEAFNIMMNMSKEERDALNKKLNKIYTDATNARDKITWMDLEDYAKEKGLRLKAEPVSYIETLTLEPNAKIANYNDKTLTEQYINSDFNDFGSFCAARGYDAINAEGHGESGSYTVILNRTKVIIKGD